MASMKDFFYKDEVETIGLNQDLTGRSVVMIIVDTIHLVEELFKAQNVKQNSLFFFKPEAYKGHQIDYVGIRIPNKFIVGFGLDYDGLGRILEVYKLKE
jgi:hypoxanthine phosphoribosyltransferase